MIFNILNYRKTLIKKTSMINKKDDIFLILRKLMR